MSKSIPVLQGRARLYPPKEEGGYWRIAYYDRITGKRRTTRGGGKTQESAELKAAELLGDYTPSSTHGQMVPTVKEVFEAWMFRNQHRWSSRTFDQYMYQGQKYIVTELGEIPISQVSPQDFRKISVSHLSRGQQTKVRSLVRGMMTDASRWVRGEPDEYASAVLLSGSRSEMREYSVQKGDIAPARFINDVINVCWSTCQPHPVYKEQNERDNKPTPYDEVTGEVPLPWSESNKRSLKPFEPLSQDFVEEHHRRGGAPRFKTEQSTRRETQELAARYRMFAFAVALAAGCGLRIGEILALRVRDFVKDDQFMMEDVFVNGRAENEHRQLPRWGYKGELLINKQASQRGTGRIVLSLPKYEHIRTVHLPAVLYSGNEGSPHLTRRRREQVIHAGVEGYDDEEKPLWDLTWYDALKLWESGSVVDGIIPLGWLLMFRLNDLWDAVNKNVEDDDWRYDDFQKLLLFPTRGEPRKNGNIEVPRNWHEDASLVPGFGGYMSTTNFANNLTNPIFDYVSEKTGRYPSHRQNLPATKRKGWTFHALRHYFVTSNIYHGVPLPTISNFAGHKSIDFTLSRYSHVLKEDYEERGFE